MAGVQRQVQGDAKPQNGKILLGDVCRIGDLMLLAGLYLQNVTKFGGTVTTRAAAFAGVLRSGATTGRETADTECSVATGGVFTFPVATPPVADQPVGTLVSATGNQQVSLGSTLADSIGKLHEPALIGATTVKVEIFSTVMTPPQAKV